MRTISPMQPANPTKPTHLVRVSQILACKLLNVNEVGFLAEIG